MPVITFQSAYSECNYLNNKYDASQHQIVGSHRLLEITVVIGNKWANVKYNKENDTEDTELRVHKKESPVISLLNDEINCRVRLELTSWL